MHFRMSNIHLPRCIYVLYFLRPGESFQDELDYWICLRLSKVLENRIGQFSNTMYELWWCRSLEDEMQGTLIEISAGKSWTSATRAPVS